MKSILIINGPNLNLLGKRQPEIYGTVSFDDYLQQLCDKFQNVATIKYFQSNHEGDIIDTIHEAMSKCDGMLLNAGAYTHTSLAIADAIRCVDFPVIEVHITNPKERETYRRFSYLEEVCMDTISGKGLDGYYAGIKKLASI